MEPLNIGVLEPLYLYSEPLSGTLAEPGNFQVWNLYSPQTRDPGAASGLLHGTFMWNLGEPGARFRAAPNHPEKLWGKTYIRWPSHKDPKQSEHKVVRRAQDGHSSQYLETPVAPQGEAWSFAGFAVWIRLAVFPL